MRGFKAPISPDPVPTPGRPSFEDGLLKRCKISHWVEPRETEEEKENREYRETVLNQIRRVEYELKRLKDLL